MRKIENLQNTGMMKKILLLLSMLMLAVVPVMSQEDYDIKYAADMLAKGTSAPDFKMQTVDGKPFQLKTLKGRYVVLDFWASWCSDCRKDAPNIVKLYKEYHAKGVEFVGVSMDTNVEAWQKAIEKYGIEYTQVSELKKFHDTDISKAYGVKWIPSMYLIDKKGKVVLATVMSEKLEKALAGLFAGRE